LAVDGLGAAEDEDDEAFEVEPELHADSTVAAMTATSGHQDRLSRCFIVFP